MSEWDVDDRADWADFQDEARAERHEEALRNAQEEEFEEKALHCANCDFSWRPGWIPRDKIGEAKLTAADGACPVCGSRRRR